MKKSFHTYAAVTILFWSLAYVLTRLALQTFSAFSLGFLRYFAASCALLIIAFVTKTKRPRLHDLPWLLLSGAAGFFLYMIAYNQGQAMVTASTASVVIATVPVITALLARVFFREKLRGFQWAAMAVELAGVVVLTVLHGVLSVNTGLVWLFLAALALSAYNLLQRRLTKTYSAFQVSAYSIFFGTLLLAVFAPAAVREVGGAPAVSLVYVAVLGVFSGAVAYAAWAKAFSLAKQTSQVSNYMFITPFVTSALGFIIAGEVPDRATLLGGGIILLGAFVFHFGGNILKRFHSQTET